MKNMKQNNNYSEDTGKYSGTINKSPFYKFFSGTPAEKYNYTDIDTADIKTSTLPADVNPDINT